MRRCRQAPMRRAPNITYPRPADDPSFAWADPDTTTDQTASNRSATASTGEPAASAARAPASHEGGRS
jgi:hypothetical protein